MRYRERNHDERLSAPAPGGAAFGGGELRERSERLLALGADAIDRALSRDSGAFLIANRQEGGQ